MPVEPMEKGAYYKRVDDGVILGQFIGAKKTYTHPINDYIFGVEYIFSGRGWPYSQLYASGRGGEIETVNKDLKFLPKPKDLEKVSRKDVYIEPLYENANNSNIRSNKRNPKSPFTPDRRGAHGGRKTRRRSSRRKTQKRRR